MAKLTLTDITAGYDTASISAANNALIEAAVENTLSRDGTTPNTMSANLDMNSNKVVNVTDGTNNQDAVTLSQLNAASVVASTTAASAVTLADAGANYTATTAEAAFTELASTTNGEGASVIGLEDAAGNVAATNVEAAIAEIFSLLASNVSGEGATLIGIADAGGFIDSGTTTIEGAIQEIFESLRDATKALIFSYPAQSLTGAGAVDVTSSVTHITTTGTDALTLADGVRGQRKYIVMISDGGTGTLTPTNLGNGTTITFDDVGDTADLLYTNSAWHFMGGTATLA